MPFIALRNIPSEQPPTGNISLREWLSRMMTLINGVFSGLPTKAHFVSDMLAQSTIVQTPLGLDIPLQLTFGPAQVTDHVDLDALGTFTIKQDNQYDFFVSTSLRRMGNPQETYLVLHPTINDNTIGVSWTTNVSNSDHYDTIFAVIPVNLVAGDTVKFYLTRDGSGQDQGEAAPFITNLVSIPDTPSTRANIRRIELL